MEEVHTSEVEMETQMTLIERIRLIFTPSFRFFSAGYEKTQKKQHTSARSVLSVNLFPLTDILNHHCTCPAAAIADTGSTVFCIVLL